MSVYSSTVAQTMTPWLPRRRPPAWLAVVPAGPHAGETLGRVAVRDPGHIHRLAARAPDPELRAMARQVCGFLTANGGLR